MTSGAERALRRDAPTSLAVDNLRAVVIVLVVAFHAVLAYLAFLPSQPYPFAEAPFAWRSFPIIDTERWLGFDLFCAWLDVYLMSFFFLLSGLFVWPSLARKGAVSFFADRVLRLAVPFTVVVLLLMPVAQYPSYLQTATDPTPVAYWRQLLALPLWPCGPMWFLWLLLASDAMAAGLHLLAGRHQDAAARLSAAARARPALFLAGFAALTAVAYVPLALLFGGGTWVQWGPISLQLSRPAHYALYFLVGVAIGAGGIEESLIGANGKLARYWQGWLAAAAASFVLWVALTTLVRTAAEPVSIALQAVDELSFSLACFASCFFALAAAMRFGRVRLAALDSLTDNAYGIYLIHYLFITWLQYALLAAFWPAGAKAAIVFIGAMIISWGLSAALRRVPACGRIIGMPRRRPTEMPPPGVVPILPRSWRAG